MPFQDGAVLLLAEAERLHRPLALGDVLRLHEGGAVARELERVRDDVDVDDAAVLAPVLPFPRVLVGARPRPSSSAGGLRDVGQGTEVRDPHGQQLVTRVAVVLDRRLVHLQEAEVAQVVDPHRHGVVLEEQAEAGLGLAQGRLRAAAAGDVAEAPHAAHRLAVEHLRDGVALEDAAVVELQDVEALHLRLGVHLLDLAQELVGGAELADRELEGLLVVPRCEHFGRDPPHLREALVVGDDAALAVDGEDAVGGGVEGGAQQRDRPVQLGLGALRLGDVVDDRVEEAPPVHFDRPGVDLDVAHLARGQAMSEAERVLALAGGQRSWPPATSDGGRLLMSVIGRAISSSREYP